MRVCLFEDHGFAKLEPLALTRPVFDLLCGLTSLGTKQARHFAPCQLGVLVRPWLADLYRLHHPATPCNNRGWLRSGPAVLVNGRWLPPAGAATDLSGPCVGLVDDEVAFALVNPDLLTYCSARTLDDCLGVLKATLPVRPAGGRMIQHLWDLVDANGEQIVTDFRGQARPPQPPGVPMAVVGPAEDLLVDPTAQIDPLVVADTRGGPVVVEAGAVVHAFTRLEGPCCVGPGSHVLGAKIRAGTTLGPQCRVGGEVEASILHGFANKYHDGFLGHAYVGEWVNLGAGTSNSDLRNDYGPVTVTVDGARVSTGLSKVGCFIGDHTKTGLGTLLNTGSNVGVCCNLLPSGSLLPKYVPSFASWWNAALVDRADLDDVFRTAAMAMGRRGRAFTDHHAALFQLLFEQTAAERRRVTRESDLRPLRKSA